MMGAPLEGGNGLGLHPRELRFRQCHPLRENVAKDLYAGDLFAMDLSRAMLLRAPIPSCSRAPA